MLVRVQMMDLYEHPKIIDPRTAPTLNRSTWSEAMAPSGARPGRVFDDEGGKYGKANRPRGCMRGQSPLY